MEKIHSQRKFVSIVPDGSSYEGFFLDYYIVKSGIRIPGSDILATVYGIEIEKKYEEEGRVKVLEQANINDIFTTKEHTEKFIKKLASGCVTPSALKYVIDDLLDEKGYEPPEFTVTTKAQKI